MVFNVNGGGIVVVHRYFELVMSYPHSIPSTCPHISSIFLESETEIPATDQRVESDHSGFHCSSPAALEAFQALCPDAAAGLATGVEADDVWLHRQTWGHCTKVAGWGPG